MAFPRFASWCLILTVPTLILAQSCPKRVPLTFLDTLNKGKEISITPADFPGQRGVDIPGQPADSSEISADASSTMQVSAPGAEKTMTDSRRESGIVPSRYKIQVVAATQQEMVKKEKLNCSGKINVPMTISFDAPYYKLFAGDFAQKSEAESLLAQIKNLGYNDAWIVRVAEKKGR